ncbi:MAG: EAL domain-containing protein, partial [Candidatus Competibacter sp.]|nr:EAL domain-containing protein [Candidatus Competibacter sp.]
SNELGDWAEWDDAYAFAVDRDPAFIQSNLGNWRVLEKNSHLNSCAIVSRDRQVLYSESYDSDQGGTVRLQAFAGERPPILALIDPVLEQGDTLQGLLSTEQGLLLLAARPILTSQGTGPARGALVFGRFLDAPLLRSLAEQIHVAFELFPADDPRLSSAERDLLRTLQPGVPRLWSDAGGGGFVYETLAGLAGRPAALLRTPLRQDLLATARHTSWILTGVLGLAALMLLLGGAWILTRAEPGEAGYRSEAAWATATVVVLCGLTVTYGLFAEWRQRSQNALTRNFQATALRETERVIATIQDNLEDLDAVRRFFEGVATVGRRQFHDFVTPILERHSFRALEWLPRVSGDRRAEYEAAARRDGLEGFQFTEPDAADRLVSAADRAEYFPVYYLEPYAGNAAALGFAPGPAHPARGTVLAQARDRGQLTATGRYILVQEPASDPRFSILVFAPVYSGLSEKPEVEERRRRLRGFVLGVIRVSDVVADALRAIAPPDLAFRLLDLSAEDDQRWLYDHPPTVTFSEPAAPELRFHQDFPLADRLWRIEAAPSAAFVARHHDQTYRWIPATGGLVTLLAALYLFALISQRGRAEALVAERTAELRASEHQFRSIVENAPFGIHLYRLTDDDRLVFGGANPAADAILKLAHAEWTGRSLGEIFPALIPTKTPAIFRRLAREGGIHRWNSVTYQDRGIDGIFEVVAFQIAPGRLAVAFTDITERQHAEQRLRQSEEKFAKIFLTTPDVVVISRLRDGLLLEVNPGFEAITGYSREEAIGRSVLDLGLWADPTDRERMTNDLRLFGQVLHRDFAFRRKDGAVRAGQFSVRPITAENEPCLLFLMQDITERRRAEAALRESEERYRLLFERANDAIFVVEKRTGRYRAANRAAKQLTGRSLVELQTPVTTDLNPGDASKRLRLAAETTETLELGEVVYHRPDGTSRTALLGVIPVNDEIVFGIARDITALKAAERRIEHQAYYDALTDLPNRALLAQRAELALALARRRDEGLAVLFLDLDRFKEVNDSLGHAEGDALLVQVAQRLQALIRAEDTACRLGGDEFVLLLPAADQEGALRVADKLLAAFRQPFDVAGHRLGTTASIGIALYPHDGADFAELLKNADTALYRAKHEGRNTRVFYDRAMNVALFERLVLEAELRQALAAGQLRAHYQPKVRLADGALVGAEALVRWQHPERGLIPPGQFVPVAEASDLIVALGDWMLAEVCRQLAAWRRTGRPPLTVAINLAARHFRRPELADRIRGLLAAHDLPARALELELTESTLLEAGPRTADTLRALERLGVGLAIDDFGTGYSSLSYLKRLPLTALKIDRTFVRDLVADPDDRILAATIVALGHQMSLVVVAEGVETEEQRRILLEQGCDLAQGFLFGPPMPPDPFADWRDRYPAGA